MILEVAEITVKAGNESAFEEAAPLFLQARGCHGLSLYRVLETAGVYRLVVKWETVDNPMVDFRNSDEFQGWRKLLGPYFDGSPRVTHLAGVVTYG